MTEQDDVAPVPTSVQLVGVNVPLPPLLLKETVPVGVVAGVSVSVTLAVHVVGWPTTTEDGLQVTVVVVLSFGGSSTTVLPELPLWPASPP